MYYLPMDSETGGLNAKTSDMLTFYIAVMDENFKMVDELDLKLKPDDGRLPIAEAGALKVNGIDIKAHMADPETITYSEAKIKILAMLKKYRKPGRWSNLIPLGHNVPFDLRYVNEHLIGEDEWLKIVHYRLADTSPIVNFLKDAGLFPSELGTLVSVVDYLGLPKRGAHNAKEDTWMCVDVYKAIIAMMKNFKIMSTSSGGGQQQDLISLLEAE